MTNSRTASMLSASATVWITWSGPNTFVVMMLTPSFSARLGISVADSFIRSRILALDIGHSSGECSAIITNCIYASPFRGAQAENAAPSIRPRGPGRGPQAAGQHKGGPPGPSASRAKQCTAKLRSDAGTVWTDAHACCSEADFVGAAGAASPVV